MTSGVIIFIITQDDKISCDYKNFQNFTNVAMKLLSANALTCLSCRPLTNHTLRMKQPTCNMHLRQHWLFSFIY